MSNKKSFEILITKDGSPTVSVSGGEPMHYLAGALSESIYNYEPTILWAIEQPQACVHSVGLGLGYNEILCFAISKSQNLPPPKVVSFESEAFLMDAFETWLLGAESDLPVYNKILQTISTHYRLESDSLKASIANAFKKGDFIFAGPLKRPFPKSPLADGVLYDAYSSQTNPELWQKDFLEEYLEQMTRPRAQVSTYAATGDLKRALVSQGFEVSLRPGFGKKRNSTSAMRT